MGIRNIINAGLGLFFVALGSIGVFFPVLPTTPFLLLAAFFFARSSERLNAWFESTDLYKNYLAEFIANRSMTKKTKLCCLVPATIAVGISFILVDVIYARIALVAIIVTMHVYFKTQIRTIPEPEVCKDCV